MGSRTLPILAAILFASSPASAGMMTSYQASGQLGYELAALASPGPPVTGNLTLSNIPAGAVIQQVFVYTNDFVSGGGQLDITVTPPVGPAVGGTNVSPTSSDPVPIATTFGYKLQLPPTSVIGNGLYGVNIQASAIGGNANQIAGLGMLVVYSHPLLPQSTITVNDGVFFMNGTVAVPGMNSTTFMQQSDTIHASANAKLSVLTFADDPATSNEQILFNGANVGGPLDANAPGGGSASVHDIGVTSTAGSTNTVALTSVGDIYGWHVAVLQTVPEPAVSLLLLLGSLGGLVHARRAAR